MSDRPQPKTVATGKTKIAADGRTISIHHPNPTGEVRTRKEYRSLKNERVNLLPVKYKAEDSNPQNGHFQCPVDGCVQVFTRKAGLYNHMKRKNGHLQDTLHDNGDGTFSRVNGPQGLLRQNVEQQDAEQQDAEQQDAAAKDDMRVERPEFNDGHPQDQMDVFGAAHSPEADLRVVEDEILPYLPYKPAPSTPHVSPEPGIRAIEDPELGHGEVRIDIFERLGFTDDFPTEEEMPVELREKYRLFRYITGEELLSQTIPENPWE
ncbi:hypothetical protein VC83_00321 [Pseudogymnoascus destructans]|uniref:C2H2-type domain-containing protein n=2 Tax=Pseudogymnoascus destructans TaxID=655981 RepID=L8G6L6_PSED2|nr:uncharacterized protein VC83_00321 [Pseudogymnoascus destructans]ELR08752.1 hypothetical protein GMDG_03431 [Pseudogymnoascus destructans 20631-21]OAF63439.1 hypothetical protein VC83_00321 [Pseudogymnoascus destructans]